MKKLFLLIASILFLAFSTPVSAIPLLQLDIRDGIYDSSPDEESIVASDKEFTLYALLNDPSLDGNKFYLSAAIVPSLDKTMPAPDIESFSINDVSYDIDDLDYGKPFKLPRHGIFETYFLEIDFEFDSDNEIDSYNSQDNPGADWEDDETGSGMLYRAFEVDVSDLGEGYELHFDLYSTITKTITIGRGKVTKEIERKKFIFAPFSHDASSGGAPVPEPATMLLVGAGLVGLAGIGRKKFKKR